MSFGEEILVSCGWEWKINNNSSTFSAPRICTVEAGHFASDVRDPALDIRRAATSSPTRVDKLGATVAILSQR